MNVVVPARPERERELMEANAALADALKESQSRVRELEKEVYTLRDKLHAHRQPPSTDAVNLIPELLGVEEQARKTEELARKAIDRILSTRK